MMSCIRPMQNERSKLAYKVIRCLPDLNVRVMGHGNEGSVRRKFDSLDWLFKVEMVEDDAPTRVNEKSPSI